MITILALFLISFASAITIYPGETKVFSNEMGIENLVYTIIGNSTSIGDLNMIITPTNISITFPQDMAPDNFQIIFLEETTKTITQTVTVNGGGGSSSGGSRRTVYKNVTEYVEVEKEIIKEVPGDTIEIEKIVKTSKWWFVLWIVVALVIGFILAYGFIFDRDTRRYEENE